MMDKEEDTDNAAFSKIKQSLASNLHSILSPPPCQVEEQAPPDITVTTARGGATVTFAPPPPKHQHHNKTANKWACRLKNRHSIRTHKTAEARFHHHFHDDAKLWCGVLNGSIPSAVANSRTTSSVGTTTNPSLPTGRPSHKIFRLPNGVTD